MRITDRKYLGTYVQLIGYKIPTLIQKFDLSENKGSFNYLTKFSVIYHLNTEGNSIGLSSYINYKFRVDKVNFENFVFNKILINEKIF